MSLVFESSARARHLVCLDILQSYLPATGGDAMTARQVGGCRRLLAYGRTRGWTITHVFEHGARARRAKTIEGLEPLQIEPVLYRTGVSAFSNRTFRASVEDAPETELIILSLSLSPACLATALAARDRGVAVALVEDVVSGSPGAAEGIYAIQTLAHSLAAPFVRIARTDDLVDSRRRLRLVS